MAVQGVRATQMWAINSAGPFSWSLWVNYGGPKPVYASTNLARVSGSGASAAYISGSEIVRDGQVLVGTGADPNQSLSSGFFFQERSLEFTVAVDRTFAWANVMLLEL